MEASTLSEQPTEVPDAAPAAAPEPGLSVLDALRARREQIAHADAPTLDLDVPGYDDGEGHGLVIRYGYPEAGYKVLATAQARAQSAKEPDALLNGNIDALIACCVEVLGRDGGRIVPLTDGDALRFGPRLATLFGIEVPPEVRSPARFIVRNVFSPRAQATGVYDGDIAMMNQAARVVTWLQDAHEKAGESFAGESQAPR